MGKIYSLLTADRCSVRLLTAASAIALMAGMGPASAQGANTGGLEEVIVTARKVSENLQQSPVAVTAFSQKDIESRDLSNLSDVASIAPNVNFGIGGDGSGSASNAVVFIRGLGTQDFSPTNDGKVGVYIDGVYLARTIGAVLDAADAQQVQVLNGPQGTLFGRNTIGGAVVLTTADPGDEYSVRIRGTAGKYHRGDILGTVDLPLTDTVSARITGIYKTRNGYVDRPDNLPSTQDVDEKGGRIKIVWTPADRYKLTVIGDVVKEDKVGSGEVATDIPEQGFFDQSFNENVLLSVGIKGATNADGTPDKACAGPSSDAPTGGPLTDPHCANDQFVLGPFKSAETSPLGENLSSYGITVIGEAPIGENISAKWITGYREVHDVFIRAEDGTPFPLIANTNFFDQHQFSQELDITSSFFDDRLQSVSGFYYFEEGAGNIQVTQFYRNDVIPNHFGGDENNRTFAFFNESTYNLTKRLRVIAGVRFTHERKSFSVFAFTADSPLFSPTYDRNFLSGDALKPGSRHFDEVTWRGGVQYNILNNIMTYATVSRGYNSGGFNLRLTQPTSENPSYGPEFVVNYELGVKSEFPEIGLRVNADAFWMRYTDLQVNANRPPEINTITFNGGDAKIRGFELETEFVPVFLPDLYVTGTFGYLDAHYTRLLPGVVISLNDQFVRSPKYTANVSASYRFNMGPYGSLTPQMDWDHKSREQFEAVNDPKEQQGTRDVYDASITYDFSEEGLFGDSTIARDASITFGVKNLTNKIYAVAGSQVKECCFVLKEFAEPRNWYLTVTKKF